jgi:Flp pilus assembly protein TadD
MPDSAAVNDTLGYVYLKRNLPTLAVPPLRLAIEREPTNPVYHYRLGLAYARTKNETAARQELEAALKLSTSFEGADEARRELAALDGAAR